MRTRAASTTATWILNCPPPLLAPPTQPLLADGFVNAEQCQTQRHLLIEFPTFQCCGSRHYASLQSSLASLSGLIKSHKYVAFDADGAEYEPDDDMVMVLNMMASSW